jgi:hypothetical protein
MYKYIPLRPKITYIPWLALVHAGLDETPGHPLQNLGQPDPSRIQNDAW